jgi:hypothetical protein
MPCRNRTPVPERTTAVHMTAVPERTATTHMTAVPERTATVMGLRPHRLRDRVVISTTVGAWNGTSL